MNRHSSSVTWLLLWVGLIASALLCRPPLPIDETRYLSVAWEMWQNNQFLVPHINGLPYSHKPPLLFWLIHFGWWVFGVNEWSARLTAPFFGLVSLVLTGRLAAVLWPESPGVGKYSPLILLSMGAWSVFGTLTMFDTLITSLSLTVYLLLLQQARAPRHWSWLLIGLVFGIGLLAKGPVILVYTLPPALLAPLWIFPPYRRWLRWYGGLLTALLAGVLLALSWAIPAAVAGGEEYGRAILFSQTSGRMVQSFAHQRPLYWYALLLPVAIFPWSLCLPLWRSWKIRVDLSLSFCLAALVPAFAMLSIISGKQIHYLLPLLPVLAIILGRIVADNSKGLRRVAWLAASAFIILSCLLLVLPALPLLGREGVIFQRLPGLTAAIPLASGCVLILSNRVWPHRILPVIASCFLCVLISMHFALSKTINSLYNPGGIISALSRVQREGHRIAVYPVGMADQFQFAARLTEPVVSLESIQGLRDWERNNQTGYCLVFADRNTLHAFRPKRALTPYRDKWLLLFRTAYN